MSSNLNIGLSLEDIRSIVLIFKRWPQIDDAILFGSRAKGSFANGSDIDIALKGRNIQLKYVLDISIELDELELPYKFDLLIYDRIKEPQLKEHIDRIGISLYSRNK